MSNSIIAKPSAIAFNPNATYFIVKKGLLAGPASIIIVTLDGTISAYSSIVDTCETVLVYDNSTEGCIYTGCVVIYDKLYVVDFGKKKISIFDKSFNKISDTKFIDRCFDNQLPPDYSPYNIADIDGKLYVTYVKQDPITKKKYLAVIMDMLTYFLMMASIYVDISVENSLTLRGA